MGLELKKKHKKNMLYCLIGPGILPIPPIGWGAVEIIIWEYAQFLKSKGHHVEIINTADQEEIKKKVKQINPDIISIHYDCFVDIVEFCLTITKFTIFISHYGYLPQPSKWSIDFQSIIQKLPKETIYMGALSVPIANVCQQYGFKNILLLPNGVNETLFMYQEQCAYPKLAIVLGDICPRKRQAILFQQPNLHFVGKWNLNDVKSECLHASSSYLGEWTKEQVYQHLTDYATLVLLSEAEADPLVVKEALVCGLGLVLSKASWSFDSFCSLPFVAILSESEIQSPNHVSHAIARVSDYASRHRQQIRSFALHHLKWSDLLTTHEEECLRLLNPVTIVTGYWDIGVSKHKHSKKEYETWMTNLLKDVNCLLIVFTNVPNMIREKRNTNYPCVIVEKSLKDLLRDTLTPEILEKQKQMDPLTTIIDRAPEVYKIWNSKIDLVNEAIQMNPFRTKQFMWTDIGNLRRTYETALISVPFPRFPLNMSTDRIDIVLLEPYSDIEQKQVFFSNTSHVSASLIGGYAEAWKQLHECYYAMLQDYLKHEQFIGCDQQIISSCVVQYPELFHLIDSSKACWSDPWFYLWEYMSERCS